MTSWLWSATDAAAATGGSVRGDWTGVSGISIDTRERAAGDLFVALAGDNRDGHRFVAGALSAGAGAAMVSKVPEDVGVDAPLLVVDDTLAGLAALGTASRARSAARVIGVTGSVGKTSTKDMLRVMLSAQGPTHAAVRSFNNHWGVPLTLARMPQNTEFAVIEIGMNHPGEITPLSRMARPHVALITTVEAVHLAAFSSIEEIADAKAEIFAGLERDGAAILNVDNAHFGRLAAAATAQSDGSAEIVPFGRGGVDWRLEDVRIGEAATCIRAKLDGRDALVKLGAPGAHFAMNALGALAAVESVGADVGRAAVSLAGWAPPSGRGSRTTIGLGQGGERGALTLLDESYNANPASLSAALDVLAAATPGPTQAGRSGRRIAILGDMLELGKEEEMLHAALADHYSVRKIDTVHSCGALMKVLHDALPADKCGVHCADSQQLAAQVVKLVDAGDVVMVKGSLGAAMKHVVAALKTLGSATPGDQPERSDGDA
ncbi:MAG: UDP-N-acetylmuramoylalanyl-D-glutamyl-2,6-diaminopimelate--D-alanyl-D-alanine ligase [Pseudomonadota bacterium]